MNHAFVFFAPSGAEIPQVPSPAVPRTDTIPPALGDACKSTGNGERFSLTDAVGSIQDCDEEGAA